MTYESFLKKIPELVQARLGEEVEVQLHTIHKNNNIKMEAVCMFQTGINVSPTIYLPPMYQCLLQGASLEEVCQQICQQYQSHRCLQHLETEDFHQLDRMKDRIVYKLIHYESNQELLQTIPHRRFLDLAVVYYLLMEHPFIGKGTVLIRWKQCEEWQVEEETLYELAQENTRRLRGQVLVPLGEMILSLLEKDMKHQLARELGDESCDEEQIRRWASEMVEHMMPAKDHTMYVLTNEERYLGAVTLLEESLLKELSQRLGCGLFVIPSSVHEVMLVPDQGQTGCEELCDLHRQVGEAAGDVMDFLSDKIYYYDVKDGLRVQ